MDAAERAAKLAFIARMTREELAGWWWSLHTVNAAGKTVMGRPYFDGEKAALDARALALGVSLPKPPLNPWSDT
jgi:hypothetical protein